MNQSQRNAKRVAKRNKKRRDLVRKRENGKLEIARARRRYYREMLYALRNAKNKKVDEVVDSA